MLILLIILLGIYLLIGIFLAFQVLAAGVLDSLATMLFIIFCWLYLIIKQNLPERRNKNGSK